MPQAPTSCLRSPCSVGERGAVFCCEPSGWWTPLCVWIFVGNKGLIGWSLRTLHGRISINSFLLLEDSFLAITSLMMLSWVYQSLS